MGKLLTPRTNSRDVFVNILNAKDRGKTVCFTCDRVSSKAQEDNTSLKSQKERGLQYAKEREFEVAANYSFVESASKRVRPNFHAMMKDAINLEVDVVVFKTVDRLARNLPDIQLVLDFIYEHKREVHLYDDGLKLTPDMDSNDALNFMLKGVLAKGETDRLGQRVRRALDFQVKEGIKPGGAIFGYRYNRKKTKHEFDPETRPVLKYLFDTFDKNDLTCEQMADLMNARGYTTGTHQKPWSRKSVHKTLTNPTYHGQFYFKGELHIANPEYHDTYYSRTRFEKRMKRLKERRNGQMQNRLGDPLKMFLRCSDCGRTLTPDEKRKPSGKVYRYYMHQCRTKDNKYVIIPQEKMFHQIDEMVWQARFAEGYASRMKKLFEGQLTRRRRDQDKSLKLLRDKLDWLRKKDGRLLDLYSDGEFERDTLKAKRAEITEQIFVLHEKEKALLTVKNEKVSGKIIAAIDELRDTPCLYLKARSWEKKATLLKKMLLGVRWSEGQAQPVWREPYAFLMEDGLQAALSAAGARPAAGSAAAEKSADNRARKAARARKNPSCEPKSGRRGRVRTCEIWRDESPEVQTVVDEVILNFQLWMLTA